MEKKIRILIACEESQEVCKAFRKLGFEAYSCDIQECSGGHPEWHYKQDVFEVIKLGWDAMIAFPPCTYLTLTGNKWMKPEYSERFPTRIKDRESAISFFLGLANAPIPRIAIENPIGIMSTHYKKPTQIIQPYFFGDKAQKTTCLWLKNLPPLFHAKEKDLFNENITHTENESIRVSKSGNRMGEWYYQTGMIPLKNGLRAKARSKTFPGIAQAMADQWGKYLTEKIIKHFVIH
jgi:hypothetical protein